MKRFLATIVLAPLVTLLLDQPPQRFGGTPESTAQGGSIQVTFTNPGAPNTNVDVTAKDTATGQSQTITIGLDANGKGTATFQAPSNWTAILLQHPTSRDWGVIVNPGESSLAPAD